MPGLVQAHVHTCARRSCRGRADDLRAARLAAPARLAVRGRARRARHARRARARRAPSCCSAARPPSSTWARCTRPTRSSTRSRATGLRATIGKAMMDVGDGVPARLRETTRASLDESDALADALARRRRRPPALRLRAALRAVVHRRAPARGRRARRRRGARLHTHACEQRGRDRAGAARARRRQHRRISTTLGLLGPRAALAHCVHATDAERALLARARHARRALPVVEPQARRRASRRSPSCCAPGVDVALGADGAPCNNNLDGFVELRLAALLHKPRAGADARCRRATVAASWPRAAARARSASSDEIGSLELGKRADVIVVDPRTPHAMPSVDRGLDAGLRRAEPRRAPRRSSTAASSCATARSPRRPASTAARWSPSPQAEAARVQARVRA